MTKTKTKTEQAIFISTDALIQVREFDKKNSYGFLSDSVGGMIECVHLASLGVDMWTNEEGKIIGLPLNEIATIIFFREFNALDRICGNVVFTSSDKNGNTVGLDEDQIKKLKELLSL